MAKGKNCPNCGAVYEPEKNKCPYCGTSYFDMTAINIPAREPFYLKVKAEMGGTPIYITQKVIADINHSTPHIILEQEEIRAQERAARNISVTQAVNVNAPLIFHSSRFRTKKETS